MDDFSFLDKLNIPIYICEEQWRVVYRNHACRKYAKVPIVNGNLSKYFVYGDSAVFPRKPGEADFVCCKLGESYKTAVSLEFFGYAAVIFPTLFDFDLLFGDISGRVAPEYAACMGDILKSVAVSNGTNYDKYGTIEKLRRLFLSSIENYVALSMFDIKNRVGSSLETLYRYFDENMVKRLNRNGYRITADIKGLNGVGREIFTDTMYFTAVLANLLLFAVGISDGKDFRIEAALMGTYVKHDILFSCHPSMDIERFGTGLEGISGVDPCGYLNVYVFERLCDALGWRLYYEIGEGEDHNGRITFEIDNGTDTMFRSAGGIESYTPEEIAERVILESLLLLL